MQIEHQRGYLVLAQNNSTTDYVACAVALAHNIKYHDPDAKVCLLTDDESNQDPVFDYVRVFPFGDLAKDHDWKLVNDWQCFYASPFRQTIKIEADMMLPRSISHWFDICSKKDLVVTIGARNYHNQIAKERAYRSIFDSNNLPDAYNAITYWRLSEEAQKFFDTVKDIFHHWKSMMSCLKYGSDQVPNTDLAYALALTILGTEKYTLPGDVPSLIHMKQAINALESEDWTHELVWEFDNQSFRINTIQQMWPVHYYTKEFAREVQKFYAR